MILQTDTTIEYFAVEHEIGSIFFPMNAPTMDFYYGFFFHMFHFINLLRRDGFIRCDV